VTYCNPECGEKKPDSGKNREPLEEQWEGTTMRESMDSKNLMDLEDNAFGRLQARIVLLAMDESGMSTVEYAIGTIAAAAFGAILYTVVTGDSIVSALTNIITRALNTNV
jgi:hypothetical protein